MSQAPDTPNIYRSDYDRIVALIPEGAHVLDLGCGHGTLLRRLIAEKQVQGCGIELQEEGVIRCVEQGLSVYQGNVDDGLREYPDQAFDFVMLNQTLQVVTRPLEVIREMLRVGRYAVVGFPNFAHLPVRLDFTWRGRMPRSDVLPFEWYNTPNIHLCTIADFQTLCRTEGLAIMHAEYLIAGQWRYKGLLPRLANSLASTALFVIAQA